MLISHHGEIVCNRNLHYSGNAYASLVFLWFCSVRLDLRGLTKSVNFFRNFISSWELEREFVYQPFRLGICWYR